MIHYFSFPLKIRVIDSNVTYLVGMGRQLFFIAGKIIHKDQEKLQIVDLTIYNDKECSTKLA